MLERTLDVLAADLGIDPVEIRRRNVVGADSFPYATPTGLDSRISNRRRSLSRSARSVRLRSVTSA